MSPEIQNRGTSGPQKRTYVRQKTLKKNKKKTNFQTPWEAENKYYQCNQFWDECLIAILETLDAEEVQNVGVSVFPTLRTGNGSG